MQELKCKNCGAPLDRHGNCHYCGARYQVDGEMAILPKNVNVVMSPKCIPIEVSTSFSLDQIAALNLSDQSLAEMTLQQLSREMARSIAPLMSIRQHLDDRRSVVEYSGKLRVVEPSAEYW